MNFGLLKWRLYFLQKGLFNFVENEYNEPYDEASDASALYFILQAMQNHVFHVVADTTSAKEAWECLRREFG